MVVADSEIGRALLQAGRWSDARAAFEAALRKEPSAEVLQGMAEAMWWTGDVRASISYYQQAFTAFRERGDSLQAAFAGIAICLYYQCCLGNEAAAGGWLSRAETAAREGDPAPVQGWIWAMRGYLATDHDLQLATQLARQALDYAALTGDRDLELLSRADLGALLAQAGRVEEGFGLIDESMAGISAGEHTRLDTVVFVCCIMLGACETASDLERATQWSSVADRLVETYGCPFLYAECRAIYGSILAATGRWTEAEDQLLSAIRLTKDAYPAVYVLALSHLADLRLRQGRIEEADSLLTGIEQELAAVLPLAAAKLAHGQAATAMALLERALRNYAADSIISIRALEMTVEAQLAMGDPDAARETLGRLAATAGQKPWPEAAARSSMAAGHIAWAQGDCPAALGHFEKAMQGFSRLGLRLESAHARLAVADIAKTANAELAILEARGALDVFDDLGALPDVDAASALLRSLGVATRPGPKRLGLLTKRENEVLRLLSSGLSNPEIAQRLVISRKTASHHVSNLLSKLALRNRAEAVAYAARMADSA